LIKRNTSRVDASLSHVRGACLSRPAVSQCFPSSGVWAKERRMFRVGRQDGASQGALLALALLALVMRVAVPQGFMIDPAGQAGLILCAPGMSGSLDDRPGAPAPVNPDKPCAFSGQAVADAPPQVAPLTTPAFWQSATLVDLNKPEQTPGRGLAAPPPPAIGPPIQLI